MNICKNKTICNCVVFVHMLYSRHFKGIIHHFHGKLMVFGGIAGGFRGFWFRLWGVKENFDFRGLRGLDFDFRGLRGVKLKKNFCSLRSLTPPQ